MDEVLKLATDFRNAIEAAKETDKFQHDICFFNFPKGCCGDAADLLGQYLIDHGIYCEYVWGNYYAEAADDETSCDIQSHAWLNLVKGRIVDITGDQFSMQSRFLNYDKSVYVGEMDEFHKLFEIVSVNNNVGVQGMDRLTRLYHTILRYI